MSSKKVDELQKSLQKELEDYKVKNKEYRKIISQRNQLDAQLNELEAVMTEFNLVKDGAEIFKLTGPVLFKQSLTEAKMTVQKRMDFIKGESKRVEDTLKNLDEKQSEHREALTKIQRQLQEASVS